tara:strand:+ start:41233 stop:44595 length:3363 start_codon:yes stop_codon:yes gene_type:complete
MSILHTPGLFIERKEQNRKDLFSRYYSYQLANNIENNLNQIDFSLENTYLQSLNDIVVAENDLGWENISYERFVWSYAGVNLNEAGHPLVGCTAAQAYNWNAAVAGEGNNNNIEEQDKLVLSYNSPPLPVKVPIGSSRLSLEYNLGRQIVNFVNEHSVTRQVAADVSLGIDEQPEEIRQSIINAMALLRVGDAEADRLIDQFLKIVFAPYPILLPPDPSRNKVLWDETTVREDRRQVRTVQRAGVPVDFNPVMHDYNEFKKTLFIEPFPSTEQPGDVQFIRLPIYRGARNGIRAPLQSLLEVVYALMGSTVYVGYNSYAPVLKRKFGVIPIQNVWKAITELVLGSPLLREHISIRGTDKTQVFQIGQTQVEKPLVYVRDCYDFSPQAKFVLDYSSYNYITSLLDAPDDFGGSTEFSTIDPQYNYYHEKYERAIASPQVPEAALPNLYIYDYITANGNNLANSPDWQNDQNAAAELNNNLDRLITLDEFEATSLPRLGGSEQERANFLDYLDQYAGAITPDGEILGQEDTGAVIDLMSDLARQYYNIPTPASQMDVYNRVSSRASTFPMSVGINFTTSPAGPIATLIQNSLTSVSLVDSVIKTVSSPESVYMYSNGFGYDPVGGQMMFMNQSDPTFVNQAYHAQTFKPFEGIDFRRFGMESEVRIYDFYKWIENANSEIENEPNPPAPRERYLGQCPRLIDNIRLQAISNQIENHAVENSLTYEQIVNGKLAHSETILYKLVKKDAKTDEIIQNFYFPNTNFGNVIKFADTQVKFQKQYRYELIGVDVVYGSKFALRPIDWSLDPSLSEENLIYVGVSVMRAPDTKIIEYPIYTREWKNTGVTGMTFPDVYVYDRPPPPPEILIAPLRGNYRQVILALQPTNESFLGSRAIPWTHINEEDLQHSIDPSIVFQKTFKNFSLFSPNLEFSGESASEVKCIEIFRSEEISDQATNIRELYSLTFANKKHKKLNIAANAPEEEKAVSFDCIDTLEPNKKYYYTARCIDVHGKISNPTPIYVVELVFERGTYFPMIDMFHPSFASRTIPTKKMARFLEIKASPIQINVQNTFDRSDNLVKSQKGFIESSENKVENNKFLVRLTSRDTGRKIQFGIKFKSNTTSDET